MKKACLLLLCTVFFSKWLLSQEARQYSFVHYNVNNGLASYVVNSVVQDEQGYMWIGTPNGLQRFDGSRFITFRHHAADNSGLSFNTISQLMFDKQNRLWVSFSGDRVGIFDTKKFTFKPVKVNLSNEAYRKGNSKLMMDSDGKIILLITFHEAVTYDEKQHEFSPSYNQLGLPGGWDITSLTEDPRTGKMWIATRNGMAVYNKHTKNISYYGHNTEHEPMIETFGNIPYVAGYLVDSKQRFWFYDWHPKGGCRIHCYDLARKSTVIESYYLPIPRYNEPAAITEQNDGSIWISGLNVFAKYDEVLNTFSIVESGYQNDQGIIYSNVNLYEDRERNLWVATNNNGVYVFNPARQLFRSIGHINRASNEPGNNGLLSFIHLNNADVLASYWGEGLYRYDHNLKNIKVNIKGLDENNGLSAWDMIRMKDSNKICMVGQPAFIAFYDQEKNTIKKYQPAIFEERTIRKVLEDRNGNLWLGMHSNGLYKWSKEKGSLSFEDGIYKINSIPAVKVLDIMLDNKGILWVGTETEGIYMIDPVTEKVTDHITDKGPAGKRITGNGAAIMQYDDTLIIIGGAGLNFYDTRSGIIRNITTSDGLSSDLVVSLEKDKAGYLWVATTTGLCRMNIQKNSFTVYDRNDGMANDNFDVGGSYKLPDGRLLYGTSKDFIVFDPLAIGARKSLYDVSITYFNIVNTTVSVDSLLKLDRIELPYNENSISIGFSNLSYNNRNKVAYYYMMEGIDKEWKQANELNQAIYSYLPPGTYTFRVKAENADREGGKVTEIKVKVNPPFWKTWWFILSVIVVIVAILYWIDRLQLKRKEGLQKIRSEIAGNLHEEVNTALNNINILSEMARIKADNEPAKSKEYIEQIHHKSHHMIIAMDDMLWSLSPENDSMQKTVERMREYIDELRNTYGPVIDITVDRKVESLELDMKLRHESFLLFKELMSYLVQCGLKNASVFINTGKGKLIFSMEFDTSTCDMIHLNNLLRQPAITKRKELINAELDVQVHKEMSRFVLLIPTMGNR